MNDLNENNIPLSQYPRPQMKRESFINLNGYWDFAKEKSKSKPVFNKKILVPFSPETKLSGIEERVDPDDYIFYRRLVKLPENFNQGKVIIHFGAVDQVSELFINDKFVIKNTNGFLPFSADITEYIIDNEFEIRLIVNDFTNTKSNLIGKQRLKSGGIFYTPQSGIWQTVWLESVPENYLIDLKITPLFDKESVKLEFEVSGNENVEIEILDGDKSLNEVKTASKSIEIEIPNMKPWTPESPYLYNLKIKYSNDLVESYFEMRKFEHRVDNEGIHRFFLNNKPYLQNGVLDQGYYHDSLLTPPTDEAMIYDIQTMKDLGFNLLRKHIKIEPLRWYYYCDKLGMLVWQDMINGGNRKDIFFHGFLANIGVHLNDKYYCLFGRKDQSAKKEFIDNLIKMVYLLKNVTSISTWVPFNEAWGQFDALKIEQIVRGIDNQRLIDHASGWSDQSGGDYHSRHIYFTKINFKKKKSRKRILALTEFGGYSLPIKNHQFNEDKVFGYKMYSNKTELETALKKLYSEVLIPQIKQGLQVLVYTQLSDVEEEINGFLTYDREVLKVDKNFMTDLNQELFKCFNDQFQ
jgi:hypothetical protein